MQAKGFSKKLSNLNLMMKLFTDEELETLHRNINRAINNFSQTEESLNKIIDFIQRRPDLAFNIITVSQETFMDFDNFTLIELCDKFVYLDYYIKKDLSTIAKSLKLKIALKKLLGAYEPKNTQGQNGSLTKKLVHPKK